MIHEAFHGTSARFRRFRQKRRAPLGPRRMGFYFTANRRFAECYGPIVLSADLTLRRPFHVEGQSAAMVIRRLPLPNEAKAELSAAFRGDDYNQYGLLEAAERFGLRDALVKMGHDGIIYEDGHSTAFVVFSADQIRIRH